MQTGKFPDMQSEWLMLMALNSALDAVNESWRQGISTGSTGPTATGMLATARSARRLPWWLGRRPIPARRRRPIISRMRSLNERFGATTMPNASAARIRTGVLLMLLAVSRGAKIIQPKRAQPLNASATTTQRDLPRRRPSITQATPTRRSTPSASDSAGRCADAEANLARSTWTHGGASLMRSVISAATAIQASDDDRASDPSDPGRRE